MTLGALPAQIMQPVSLETFGCARRSRSNCPGASEDMEYQPSDRGIRIDLLGRGVQAETPCLQVGDGLQQVRHGPAEAIELPDRERIAVTEPSEGHEPS